MDESLRRKSARALHNRHGLRPLAILAAERGPSDRSAWRIWFEQARERENLPRISSAGVFDLNLSAAVDHRTWSPRHTREAVQAGRRGLARADDRLGAQSVSVYFGVRLRERRIPGLEGRFPE